MDALKSYSNRVALLIFNPFTFSRFPVIILAYDIFSHEGKTSHRVRDEKRGKGRFDGT